jgi:hypothetical protein
MTLREFLDRHTSRDLSEIEARDRIDPIDPVGRIELAIAKLTCLLFNVNRDPDKSESATVEDFLPQWSAPVRERIENANMPQTVEQLRAKMASGFSRMRGNGGNQ